jgi:phosphoglycerate dehydrogenase-like enzyme
MKHHALTLLVMANPRARQLRMLEQLPEETNIGVGLSLEALEPLAAEADVILRWGGDSDLLRQLMAMAPRLAWIHSMSAGVENTLFPELVASPVPLTNSRGVYRRSLAEFVIASILFFAKDLRRMLRNQAAHRWEQFDVEEIHGRMVGVIGYGEIGRAVAEKAHAMGMKVEALRKRPEFSEEDPYIDRVLPVSELLELLRSADYVVITAPLTPETRHMIGEEELRAMKPGAVLINIGRGPVVREDALIQALKENWIRGAALDVFDEEPLPPNHPFWDMENVLLSPHTADHTATWLDEAMQFFLENFERFRKDEPLLNVVDKQLGY